MNKLSKYYYSNILNMDNTVTMNPKKIIGIQFSILSAEEIRKASVVEITNRDTYINNKPVVGGLFDPRMGILDSGMVCPTDGYNYINTPGYFGHIELAKPVFYIQYLNTIIKILKCVCIKCSKLLLDKNNYKYLLDYNNDERWNHVFKCCNKIKRCGEENNNGCGCKQPSKIKKEEMSSYTDESDSSDYKNRKKSDNKKKSDKKKSDKKKSDKKKSDKKNYRDYKNIFKEDKISETSKGIFIKLSIHERNL